MNIRELTKEEFEKFTVNTRTYVHAPFLTGEKVTYDSVEYFVLKDLSLSPRLARADAAIAHLVNFYSIDETGTSVVDGGWKLSSGKAMFVRGPNGQLLSPLTAGTRYKVVRPVEETFGQVRPGTLAIRYPDYPYPSN